MDNRTIVRKAGALTVGDRQVRRVTWIYSAVALGVSFLLTVINFLLSKEIDGTAGLAGIGSRTMLSTAQALLTVASTVFMPFWDMGYYAAALDFSRERQAADNRLLEGFFRFGRVLGFLLLRGLFLGLLAVICFYGATTLYMISPLGDRLLDAMEPVIMAIDPANPDMSVLEGLMPSLVPLYAVAGLAALAFVVPAIYRLRLGHWYLMDKDISAKAALRASARVMRGKRWSLFLLDLRFWWYYALQVAALAVAYADLLLPGLDGDVGFFACYIVSLLLQFALCLRVMPRVQVAYALYYKEKGQAHSVR